VARCTSLENLFHNSGRCYGAKGVYRHCNSGKCGLFGKGGLIMFDVSSVTITYHIGDLLPVIVLGVIGGVFGGLYNYLLDKVLRIYNLINEYAS
jgi:chloride channel 7